jgi:predicted lipoprotein with Yx(FWY)xxD motif
VRLAGDGRRKNCRGGDERDGEKIFFADGINGHAFSFIPYSQINASRVLETATQSPNQTHEKISVAFSRSLAMKTSGLIVATLMVSLLAAGPAGAADGALRKVDGVLVDANGRTVYTFDKDTADSGKSACNGPCATSWPPVPADAAPVSAPFSIVTREDGTKQIAYKGKQLYLYAAD